MKSAINLHLPPGLAALLLGTAGLAAQQEPPIPADRDPQTTDSGLVYSVLAEGEGDSPRMGDRVRVHYTGWLESGDMFDSSRRRGEPAEFVLGQVIEGWNEGLQLMKPGARYKLTIPHDLAYGEEGRPPTIPAKATLIFDVELLGFESGPEFRPVAEDAEETESGLRYEVLRAGSGESPAEDEWVALRLAWWNGDEELVEWTHRGPVFGPPGQMGLPVVQEVAQRMEPGAIWLVEAPASQALGQRRRPDLPAESTTTWRIELESVFREPAFEEPDLDRFQETESGLRYRVLREGEGESPGPSDRVMVFYVGRLEDGTEFDSAYDRGQPATFGLNQVIPGWTEGLQLMEPGAHYRFVIPAELGYGERGSPPNIPGGATLLFDVELLRVQ